MNPTRPPRPRAKFRIRSWTDYETGEEIPGVSISARYGMIAYLTVTEARATADKLHDFCDQLEATAAPPKAKRQRNRTRTRHSSTTLTDANGAPEEPLPTAPAESE